MDWSQESRSCLIPQKQPESSLELLDLRDCNLVTNKALEHLSLLQNLKALKVYGPQITDEGMQHLPKMLSLKVLIM